MKISKPRTIAATLAAVASLAAGATAQHWNPYSAELSRCSVETFEDGSAVTTCGELVVPIPNDPATDGALYAP